ncbi:21785_t:CDS:2 [Cetraspora pellucida]|uniref:21785_t:CDS:1 n=1 Tax=Cetraspora pellucida TaxID=1433469 RepID=A0A9N9C4Y4_9GLOM|nr:21785_t:CDS:2 [Cetraspora pellucida]
MHQQIAIKRKLSDRKNEFNGDFSSSEHVNFLKKSKLNLIRHPLGIMPLGNYYIDSTEKGFRKNRRETSLGAFAHLTDEIILEIFGHLNVKELLTLGFTSQVLYCFSSFEELWKQLTIRMFNGDWWWYGTWKLTYLKRSDSKYDVYSFIKPAVNVTHFYSDVLFQPFLYSLTEVDRFLGTETINRRSNLSMEEFNSNYAAKNRPVIITDVVTQWPAFQKWSMKYLVEKYGNIQFRAEAIDIKLKNYAQYSANTLDESPLYLFDKKFGEKCDGILEDFFVPEYFSQDFFNILGHDRPDFRWIIIGPARSGSTFHKDPNSTSAWNAVIKGSKKWIMYPPDTLPPGVFTSADEAEVTSPVSLMEWHFNYYKETQKSNMRPLEGICRAGEMIFVPNGWWHMVINLEDSIAITQNFVGLHNLSNVLKFLREKPEQISGFSSGSWSCKTIHEIFCKKLQKVYPGLLEKLELCNDSYKDNKPSIWEQIKKPNDAEKGFTFNFSNSE